MNLNKISQPREQILALAMLVFMFSAFFRYFYNPKQAQKKVLVKQYQTLKLEKDALEKLTQAMRQNRPSEKPTEETLSPKVSILKGDTKPVVQGISPLLAYITTPQFLNNLDIKKMSGLLDKKESGFNKFAFIIQGEGSFRNVSNYIKRIEELESLVIIDSIHLMSAANKSSQVTLDLKGILFEWSKEEETVPMTAKEKKKGKKGKNDEKK